MYANKESRTSQQERQREGEYVGVACSLVSGGSTGSLLGKLMRSPGSLISLITWILLCSALLFSRPLHSSEADTHSCARTDTHTLINTHKTLHPLCHLVHSSYHFMMNSTNMNSTCYTPTFPRIARILLIAAMMYMLPSAPQ